MEQDQISTLFPLLGFAVPILSLRFLPCYGLNISPKIHMLKSQYFRMKCYLEIGSLQV